MNCLVSFKFAFSVCSLWRTGLGQCACVEQVCSPLREKMNRFSECLLVLVLLVHTQSSFACQTSLSILFCCLHGRCQHDSVALASMRTSTKISSSCHDSPCALPCIPA